MKAHILEPVLKAQILDLQNSRCVFLLIGEALRYDLASGHIVGELVLIKVLCAPFRNIASTTEDGKPLRDFKYFVQFVRDKENRDTARLQFPNETKERLHLFLGQTRRRLIHDNQPCIVEQCSADGDHLPHAKGEIFHKLIQIQRQIDLRECGKCNLLHTGLIHESSP